MFLKINKILVALRVRFIDSFNVHNGLFERIDFLIFTLYYF